MIKHCYLYMMSVMAKYICMQKDLLDHGINTSQNIFLCPKLCKSGEHIAFGLSVCSFVRLFVRPLKKKIKARVLKFHIWIPH